MADIQHRGALELLPIIYRLRKRRETITYSEAARRIRRPAKHAKAVAQMCDLLDAAACLADVRPLALTVVLEKGLVLNHNAWKNLSQERRQRIFDSSSAHEFSLEDIHEIKKALYRLRGLGNRNAWKYLHEKFGDNRIFYRVIGLDGNSAIHDFEAQGSDTPDRAEKVQAVYKRDPIVRATVIRRGGGKCEYCNKRGFLKSDGSHYLETHHVIALANEGRDKPSNVIALCPNDHREAHFGANAEEMEEEMIRFLRHLYKK